MDVERIGQFIAELRKEKMMTQKELANLIMVSDKTISKWETGKGLPDPSSWLSLSNNLGVSVTELLQGKKLEMELQASEANNTIVDTTLYIESAARRKGLAIISFGSVLIFSLIILLTLSINLTFFKDNYSIMLNENRYICIPVPRYSFYRSTSGMYIATFKTLRQEDEVRIFIDNYLATLDEIKINEKTQYYDKFNDITIWQYNINNGGIGPINTIYVSYDLGRSSE